MRPIDADALMQTLGITDMDCEKCEWGDYNHCIRGGDFEDACSAIENAPTIEPERKTGRWIAHPGGKFVGFPYMHYECDQCRNFEPTETDYCPHCGADMRGENE